MRKLFYSIITGTCIVLAILCFDSLRNVIKATTSNYVDNIIVSSSSIIGVLTVICLILVYGTMLIENTFLKEKEVQLKNTFKSNIKVKSTIKSNR